MVVLSVFLLAIGYRTIGPKGYLLWQQREREKQGLRSDVRNLMIENLRLRGEAERLDKADPKTMERLARQELRLAKPGEVIYVLPPPAKR